MFDLNHLGIMAAIIFANKRDIGGVESTDDAARVALELANSCTAAAHAQNEAIEKEQLQQPSTGEMPDAYGPAGHPRIVGPNGEPASNRPNLTLHR